MDKNNIRATILKLVDGLSDIDRRRLHFYFGKDVPRRISDDQSYEGTLRLIESLFDQDKLSNKNLNHLIEACFGIDYHEGVKILREYQDQIQKKSSNQCQTVVSLGTQIMIDQEEEDKSATQFLLTQVNNITQSNQIIGSKHTSINPVTINVENKPVFSPRLPKNQPFYLTFKINKCLSSIILFLILIITVLSCLLIVNLTKHSRSDDTHRLEINSQQNQQIISLRNQLDQINESLNRSLFRPGLKFGVDEDGNGYFDDSNLRKFTCSHYLNEIDVRADKDGMESYIFKYKLDSDPTNMITSYLHGNEDTDFIGSISFNGEKIVKVEGLIFQKIIPNLNGTKITKTIITNLVFTTESGVRSSVHTTGDNFNFQESFRGFHLGYVTGKKNDFYINQIQFFWCRD